MKIIRTPWISVLGLLAVVGLSACVAMQDGDSTSSAPTGPVVKLPDAPEGLSILSAATQKYATWGPQVDPCGYAKYYISRTPDGKAHGVYRYDFVVWNAKGKPCRRSVDELIALAPRCARPDFPSSSRLADGRLPTSYAYLGTAQSGESGDREKFERANIPATGIFRHDGTCNTIFIDN
jgi:hypothetical protein